MRYHRLPNAESFLFSWYGFVVEVLLNSPFKTIFLEIYGTIESNLFNF